MNNKQEILGAAHLWQPLFGYFSHNSSTFDLKKPMDLTTCFLVCIIVTILSDLFLKFVANSGGFIDNILSGSLGEGNQKSVPVPQDQQAAQPVPPVQEVRKPVEVQQPSVSPPPPAKEEEPEVPVEESSSFGPVEKVKKSRLSEKSLLIAVAVAGISAIGFGIYMIASGALGFFPKKNVEEEAAPETEKTITLPEGSPQKSIFEDLSKEFESGEVTSSTE